MAKTKVIHYGKELETNMDNKGVKALFVMNMLKIKSYDTFKARLKDGKFSHEQLQLLTEKGLV